MTLLAKKGAEIDAVDHRQWTPLMVACQNGNKRSIETLIHLGASTEARTNGGHTPLMIAVQTDDAEAVASLVENGASVNAAAENNSTALHLCASHNLTKAAAALLSRRAHVESKDSAGLTPLMIATAKGHLEMMRVLLEHGASPTGDDCQERVTEDEIRGGGPFRIALAARNRSAIKLLCQYGANLDVRFGEEGMTLLMAAVVMEHKDLVEFTLSLGCDVNATNAVRLREHELYGMVYCFQAGYSAMHVAAGAGNVEIGRMLLDAGAKLSHYPGDSPLDTALGRKKLKFIDFLLLAGADVFEEAEYGTNVIHVAVQQDIEDPQFLEKAFRMLMRRNVSINHKDHGGGTPLHYAAARNAKSVVRVLIALGADVSVKDKDGHTPLTCACSRGSLDSVKVLVEQGKADLLDWYDGSHPLAMAAEFGYGALMQYLLKQGVPIHLPKKDGYDALMTAVFHSNINCVRILIKAGADVNAAHACGRTVLLLAVLEGNLEVLQLLLQNGANPNQRGEERMTAIHAACGHEHQNRKKIIALLLKYPVDVNCVWRNGCTPLLDAVRRGDDEVVRMLLNAGAIPNGLTVQDGLEPGEVAAGTPLNLAIGLGHVEIVGLLIERGADVNERDRGGLTPLFVAAERGQRECAKLLWDAGADLDAVSVGERTAVLHAVHHRNLEIARDLVEAGADVDIPSQDGATALHEALKAGDVETAFLMIRHGANVNGRAEVPSSYNTFECKLSLVGNAADLHRLVCGKCSLRAAACRFKSKRGCHRPSASSRLLLDVKVEALQNGNTALHRAVVLGFTDCARRLIHAGANANILNNDGESPLHRAAIAGCAQIVEQLLENYPDLCLDTGRAKAVVNRALNAGHRDIAMRIQQAMNVAARTRKSPSPMASQPANARSVGKRASTSIPAPKSTRREKPDESFCCPITLDLMDDPVVAADGHSYERAAITTWLQSHGTSPVTNQRISLRALIPNLNLKHQIDVYKSENGL